MKLVLLIMTLFAAGCVTSTEKEVKLAESIEEDTDYAKVYDKVTSKYEVIKNFETRIVIHTTALTSEFRRALGDRYQKIFNEPEPILEEASNNAGFFVSLYTANKELNDLNNKQLWTIQLDSDNHLKAPVLVKFLSDKPRWEPFFSGISPWSREYLVLFESSQISSNSNSQMLSPKSVKLILSNSDGRISMGW